MELREDEAHNGLQPNLEFLLYSSTQTIDIDYSISKGRTSRNVPNRKCVSFAVINVNRSHVSVFETTIMRILALESLAKAMLDHFRIKPKNATLPVY